MYLKESLSKVQEFHENEVARNYMDVRGIDNPREISNLMIIW